MNDMMSFPAVMSLGAGRTWQRRVALWWRAARVGSVLGVLWAVAGMVMAQTPQAPEIAARAYLLFDQTTGQELAARAADEPVEPASLTKLMSAYLVFDALKARKLDLQQRLPVSVRAWKMSGSRMFIDPKMQVPVEDLLKGMIVQSGNDATVALAEGVGGSVERFVQLMNDQARLMGLKNTQYANPEGLTAPGHKTTARDLALLAARMYRDHPEYVGYYAIRKYRYEGTPAANDTNRNLLLFRDPTVDGLKTGHTEAAGYCLIASARRDFPNLAAAAGAPAGSGGRRLIAVVLGASSETARANEAQKLLNWGYTAFDAVRLYTAGEAIASPQVWKGKSDQVKMGAAAPVVVSVPAGTATRLKPTVAFREPIVAPIAKGQAIGSLEIRLDDQALATVPLVAVEAVEASGPLGRAWDTLRLWLK